LRILTVDDSHDSVVLLAKVLGDHNVIYCTTEQEIHDELKRFKPELIIFDYLIHETNAIEIYDRLSEQMELPTCFCVSGYSPKNLGLCLAATPFSAWFQKPFNWRDLREAITRLELGVFAEGTFSASQSASSAF